jgi:hypothetical protein
MLDVWSNTDVAPGNSERNLRMQKCLRTLALKPSQKVEEIWTQAEQKLKCSRNHFALVTNSHYLPQEGILSEPKQFFEIRWRGGGGGDPALSKGSQAYRESQTAKKREKYRQREAHQAEIKKESQLQVAIEDSRTVSVLVKQIVTDDSGLPSWQYVKHSNQKLFEPPPKAQIRHFHTWIERITGIPRNLQKFSQFDDPEAVTFRRCTDLKSPDFQQILGKTFRLFPLMKKKPKIQQWRFRDIHPATIPTHGNFSRPVRRHDISKFGLHFQKNKEPQNYASVLVF